MLSELRVGVQSLVRELKFRKPPGTAKNKKTKKKRKLKRKEEISLNQILPLERSTANIYFFTANILKAI